MKLPHHFIGGAMMSKKMTEAEALTLERLTNYVDHDLEFTADNIEGDNVLETIGMKRTLPSLVRKGFLIKRIDTWDRRFPRYRMSETAPRAYSEWRMDLPRPFTQEDLIDDWGC